GKTVGHLDRGVVAAYATILLSLLAAVAHADVVEIPMVFEVEARNGTLVPCPGGATGPVLIGATLITPDVFPTNVTLYLHGLGFGQWFWHFQGVSGFDYAAELAAQGHASLVVDRLGYGVSDHPDGNQSCIGIQAD